MAPRYFEDFCVGEVIQSPTYEATSEEIIWFAQRYDPQYYHLDAQRARESIFGGLVAGGFQTAALAWALALRTGCFQETAVAGIGVEELRWLRPLRVGDIIHTKFKLIDGRPSKSRPGTATTKFSYDVINQHGEVVMSAVFIQIIKCRPSDIKPPVCTAVA